MLTDIKIAAVFGEWICTVFTMKVKYLHRNFFVYIFRFPNQKNNIILNTKKINFKLPIVNGFILDVILYFNA